MVTTVPVVAPKKRIEIVADVPEEPSFLESLFDNPLALGGVALAILLGAGGLWYARRRQRPGIFEDSIITGGDLKANTVLGSTGGGVISTQSTENSFLTDFSRQGLGTIDTDEVDPIAEAEVYMAYGRDAQAEEILKDALNKDPSRHEIRMKLLDIYGSRKDKVSFEEHASALFAITAGKGAHWEHAAEFGRTIDPENPLYQTPNNAGMVDTTVATAAVLGAGSLAVAAAMADATEPDLTQDLSNDLDFELDLDSTAQLRTSDSLLTPDIATALDNDLEDAALSENDFAGLSFDSIDSELESMTIEEPLPATQEPTFDQMMDLDLPIDLGAAPDLTTSDFDDLDALADFDLDAALNPIQDAPTQLSPSEINELDAFSNSLDLDMSAPADDLSSPFTTSVADLDLPELGVSPENQGSNISNDLDDIGLDFGFDLNDNAEINTPLTSPFAANSMDAALDDISLDLDAAATGSELDFAADDPVQTKIDLARAYIDMGDVEGAREILQEAVQEGNSVQQDLAKVLLADL